MTRSDPLSVVNGAGDPWPIFPRTQERFAIICAERNLDYGPDNIAQGGLLGLVTRIGDKYHRMRSIVMKAGITLADTPAQAREKIGRVVKSERFEDIFVDLSNYGAIADIWYRDLWGYTHDVMFGDLADHDKSLLV